NRPATKTRHITIHATCIPHAKREERSASLVLRDCGSRGPDITAAELDRAHDEGSDLVQGHATFPAGLQRVRLAVRGETLAREPTEEPHHREVELAVA